MTIVQLFIQLLQLLNNKLMMRHLNKQIKIIIINYKKMIISNK